MIFILNGHWLMYTKFIKVFEPKYFCDLCSADTDAFHGQ